MKHLFLFFVGLCAPLLALAQPSDGFGGRQEENIEMEYSRKIADINYAGDEEVYHNLDIYLPKAEKEKYPVVLHIYGSAWLHNDWKGVADLGTIVQALLDAGYAVVTPNHRSSSDANFPAQIHDIKAALRFVRANADKYHFDADFIATSGFSSGGHLSSLAATSGGVAALEGSIGEYTSISSKVDAACNWSGPIDMFRMNCDEPRQWGNTPEEALIGHDYAPEYEDLMKAISPISYIDPSDPSIIIFHGVKDDVVPCCQGIELFEALDKAGVKTDLHLEPEGGHGVDMYSESNLKSMVDFLNKAYQDKKTSDQTQVQTRTATGKRL